MNALTKISLYCVYKESDISSFFSWCAYLLLTCFFFLLSTKTLEILLAQFMPTGRLYLHRIPNLQLMHSQYIEMMKHTVISLIGGFRIIVCSHFFSNICIYCLFRCCSFECTSFECNVLLNYDVNLRQIEIKKFPTPATPGRMLSIVQSLKWNATAPFPRHNFEAVVTVLICWLQCHPGVF